MSRLTPSASRRTHLLVAACLWTVIGCFLAGRGVLLLAPAVGGRLFFWLLPAIAVGVAKALFVLDRVARKNSDRIENFGDRTCIGGVYSWKTWLLVLAMAIGGRLLRNSPAPSSYVGAVYVAIGTALVTSSRVVWRRWAG